jgi:predicted nucleotidyltransferase
MRLTAEQRERIVGTVRGQLGSDAEIWLYGSRTRNDGRGGDVDLLIKTQREVDAVDQARVHSSLERAVSLPVDVSFVHPRRGMTRFQRLVAAQAVLLESS